ncbi:hypothetical protein O7621_18770 [Solwaraspora sp. WMMD937]|nr:hypothetical protein [Solwaraspora sp. WMMD937]WFE19953.1 hypothetical protein O7621_18770 [Solwaraspora sp. WMMD937]
MSVPPVADRAAGSTYGNAGDVGRGGTSRLVTEARRLVAASR